ncbi:alpha-glucan family phosphorylase [Candidatus Dojkabacteria bacterium]|nr:alpha-glucan family phosphorylase [Candidatus Dojkabacteria bacterium]
MTLDQIDSNKTAYTEFSGIYRTELSQKLEQMFSNLYYTWNKDLYDLADRLDGYNWRKTNNPATIIQRYIEESNMVQQDIDFGILSKGFSELEKYMKAPTWFDEKSKEDVQLAKLNTNPILYISAEFGFVEWLQIYSGGLGILAGDFIKQASDHGIPLFGVGLFYHHGFFHQDIDSHGMQYENYSRLDPAGCLLHLVKDKKGEVIKIEVIIKDHVVFIRAWELKVGRTSVYLLDTNFDDNDLWEDKMITAHLYGGSEDTRIRQEIILGIGGYRFIKKLGVVPSVIHMNEGHASFALLEKLKEITDKTYIKAKFIEARKNILFTNHTLVTAGNDKFEYAMLKEYLEPYARELGVTFEEIFEIGSESQYSKDKFSMTVLGLRGSKIANAVSKLHGEAAKNLWPDYKLEAVTNGVHTPTWICKPIQELFFKYVDPQWNNPTSQTNWDNIRNIPNNDLWLAHKKQKEEMIKRVNATLGVELNPEILTFVWTRRFAAYKRPQLFLNDLEQLAEILYSTDRPMQFLIGGKAHPKDILGKELLQKVVQVTLNPRFKNKITFLTGYNWNLARYLVSGADIWLNNPIRFEEACGTSGMKAGANGVIQFTTLDGWTDEVDWYGKGWALPQENISNEIYNIIRDQIKPLYYENSIPENWINMMKETMIITNRQYNSGRMMGEYIELYKQLIN